ncbi:MAG TPA: HD domain-containing phosphohydrolase [Actinomycetota bacterium]|nr:HD domain-containing phosphohydrolase [Actinomycetota bacterium]
MSSRLRLAEVLGSLSLATDLATANPVETGIDATIIATRLAERAGVPPEGLPATYYACLTRMLGCTSTGMETAAMLMGDDRLMNHTLLTCDWAEPADIARRLGEVMPQGGARDDAIQRVVDDHESIAQGANLHCSQAMMLTTRLPLPADVPALLGFMWARWDGKFPGAAGADIPVAARIIPLARAIALARRAGGTAATEAVVRERKGTEFDPELCDLFASSADDVLDGLDGASGWDVFLDTEPGSRLEVGPDELLTVAGAFADFADQKSGWFAGHSRRVSALAGTAAAAMGLDAEQQHAMKLAGLLHDVGRVAVRNGVWDKAGALTLRERQLAESHSYHTEAVLKMSPTLTSLAGISATAHERADGTGYHSRRRAIDPSSALLGIADVYDAMSHERSWRPAFAPEDVVAEIRSMCASGSLHAECAAAILSAAHGGQDVEVAYPAGLTAREVDVIRLLITGLPTKTIASRLSISPKTADKHIQSVYEKTGLRGRAPVALFALEHGIFGS